VPKAKPIVGSNAFAHVLDTHVLGMQKDPYMYEPFDPALVGNQRRFPLSRLSGPAAVTRKLKNLGMALDQDQMNKLVDQLREKAEALRGEIGDEEFVALAKGLNASEKE
jgi:homocitrate synthase NifV